MQQDRKTQVALREIHLENALTSLRKAITVAGSDIEATELTQAAQVVAQRRRQAGNALADMREAEARLAANLLEG